MMALLDAATQTDIRDIRGPLAVPTAPPWLLIAAGLLAAMLTLGVLVRLVRARRARAPSPYEQATARLRAATDAAAAAPADELAEQVSFAVRDYVESRFTLRAAHRTTEELLSELLVQDHATLSSYRGELERFLSTCDLAKFAGRGLPSQTRQALCLDAQSFVDAAEATRPKGSQS